MMPAIGGAAGGAVILLLLIAAVVVRKRRGTAHGGDSGKSVGQAPDNGVDSNSVYVEGKNRDYLEPTVAATMTKHNPIYSEANDEDEDLYEYVGNDKNGLLERDYLAPVAGQEAVSEDVQYDMGSSMGSNVEAPVYDVGGDQGNSDFTDEALYDNPLLMKGLVSGQRATDDVTYDVGHTDDVTYDVGHTDDVTYDVGHTEVVQDATSPTYHSGSKVAASTLAGMSALVQGQLASARRVLDEEVEYANPMDGGYLETFPSNGIGSGGDKNTEQPCYDNMDDDGDVLYAMLP